MSGAVRFDLTRGRVSLRDETNDRRGIRAVVPMEALSALCREVSSEVVSDFGHRIGNDLGRRVAERLSQQVQAANAQTIVDHLGGELALMGLGSLRLELWGKALVFALDESALLVESQGGADDAGARLIAAVIEGAVARGLSRDAKVLPIARGEAQVRLLVCNAVAKDRVQGWLSEGCHYGEALARLNEAGGGA